MRREISLICSVLNYNTVQRQFHVDNNLMNRKVYPKNKKKINHKKLSSTFF